MKNYLPVGTVVLLHNGKKPVVIIGYKVASVDQKIIKNNKEEKSNQVFDYCAVLYPEGIISSNLMIMFNHEDIEKILFTGYVTDESKELIDSINQEEE